MKNNQPDTIGKRMREARLRAGLTQAKLAKRLRVNQCTISSWESCEDVYLSTAARWAKACGETVWEMIALPSR